MSELVLSVRNLSKKIKKKWIIKNISFEMRAGEILGFLGPNGAGKTTTIRMLVNLIRPTSGEIFICGKNVQRQFEQAMQYVGSIVENPELYPYLTGYENLEHFAIMIPGVDRKRIDEVVSAVKMEKRIHDKVKTYSLGMRQRLGIALALLSNPKLLILDEPTNGLDPQGIRELRAFVRELASAGMSIFISSHLLSEIQLMCDRVTVIREGEIIGEGVVDEMLRQSKSRVRWEVSSRAEALRVIQESELATLWEQNSHTDDEIDTSGEHGGQVVGTTDGIWNRGEQLEGGSGENFDRELQKEKQIESRIGENKDGRKAKIASEALAVKPNSEVYSLLVNMEQEQIPALNRLLVEAGVLVYAVEPLKKTLEDLFLELTGGGSIG